MLSTTLLTMYTFRRLLDRGGAISWLTYAGALILAIASFVANVFLPLVHGLYLLWSPSRRQMLGTWLVCVVLVGIPFVGWTMNRLSKTVEVRLPSTEQQAISINLKKLSRRAANTFSPAILPYTFFVFSVGFSQGPSVLDLHQSRSLATVLPYTRLLVSLGILFGILFIVGLIAIWRHPDTGKLITLWMFLPLCGVLVIAFITNLGFNVRYTAMALPAYLLIIASGIAWFRRLAVQLILLAAVLCSNGLSLANYYTDPHYARADGRAAVQYLMEARQARDVILVVGSTRTFTYYSKGNLPFEIINSRNLTDRDLTTALQRLTQDRDRLWVFEIRPWERDPKGKIMATLDGTYDRVEQKEFPGVAIRRYHIAP
jgi:MFS family permease